MRGGRETEREPTWTTFCFTRGLKTAVVDLNTHTFKEEVDLCACSFRIMCARVCVNFRDRPIHRLWLLYSWVAPFDREGERERDLLCVYFVILAGGATK